MAKDATQSAPKWPKRPHQTTVRLPEELELRAKHYAVDHRMPFGKLVEEALKHYLTKK